MSADVECQLRVSDGVLRGKISKSQGGQTYYSFLGIPYAEPPLGELRFKAPVKKQPWSGVLDAVTEGNCSAQLDMFNMAYIGNEDCLYLNIHTPSLPADNSRKLLQPVMVFIHGGAFTFMSGSIDWFTPDFIVESDVILVSINFRLGALGFLSLDIPEAPGNAGLKDQQLALKWIKDNIECFNGDSENITLFGISSGGVSIEYHMLAPMSKGLFHKAIIQSGSVLNPWAKITTPTLMVQKMANILCIEEEDPEKLCQILRDVSVEKIVMAAFKVAKDDEYKNCNMFPFTPVVEKMFSGVNAFLDKDPLTLLKDGEFTSVPAISGYCSDEGYLFKTHYSENLIKDLDNKLYEKFIPKYYGIDSNFIDSLKGIYSDHIAEKNTNNFLSDIHFLSGIYRSVKFRAARRSHKNYFYQFSYDGKLNFLKAAFKMSIGGAFHGDESTYLSMSKYVNEVAKTAEDEIVRKRMIKMWTDFAKFGDPTPKQTALIQTKWQPVLPDGEIFLLDINKESKMISSPHSDRMELWKAVYL